MKWEDVEARKAIRRLTGFLRGDAFPLLKADLSNKGIDTGRALLARWERTGEGRFQGLVASHDDELFSFGWTRLEGRGQTTSWRPWGQDEAIVGEVDGGARLRRNIRLMLERVGEA
ncbi:MAG: hypothetical protein ACXVDD_16985, partial [Polyangia bacterium]